MVTRGLEKLLVVVNVCGKWEYPREAAFAGELILVIRKQVNFVKSEVLVSLEYSRYFHSCVIAVFVERLREV